MRGLGLRIVLAITLGCGPGSEPKAPHTDGDGDTDDPSQPLPDYVRFEVLGEPRSELGFHVACTSDPVGVFRSAVAAGAPAVDNENHGGWAILTSADRVGRLHLPEADLLVEAITGTGTSSQPSQSVGTRVGLLGDLNGTGSGGFMVTATGHKGDFNAEGGAFWFETPHRGTRSVVDADAVILGGAPIAKVGGSEPVGDVDGDGNVDVLVAATWWGGSGIPGQLRFYSGGDLSGGLGPADAIGTILAEDTLSPAGLYMATGDLDGDGLVDLAVAENNWDSSRGRVFVLSGPLLEKAAYTDAEAVLVGEAHFNSTGVGLTVGDINGDGLDDLILSSHVADLEVGPRAGRVHVFFGPVLPGERSVLEADLIVESSRSHAFFGFDAVVADHDGDGDNDLIVSAISDPYFGPQRGGTVYVFRGPLGPGTLTSDHAEITYEDAEHFALFGYSLAACDLDGDGAAEIVVGANRSGDVGHGRVTVIEGVVGQ